MNLDGWILVARVKDVFNNKELTIVASYLEPGGKKGNREEWQVLSFFFLPTRTIFIGDFNIYANNKRDICRCSPKSPPLAHLMKGFMEKKRVVETIESKDLDLTQLTRWFSDLPANLSYNTQGALNEPPLNVSNDMDQSDDNIKLQTLPPN
ncbi:hypothetical protein DSO57_1004926 [Entomophthora muscae]|uniref:Uncharacterized protein n=1 Tax=Entomophthora muscae TaxID=34485 RepID=A0ACC2SL01_9FUNG|nr:hypothetical protein DSO57_1004926 [Entomophthora muscae]